MTRTYGPVRVTATENGLSWGLHVWPLSWSRTTGVLTVDLPGPLRWERQITAPKRRRRTATR